jgi:hypothetical protein
MARIRTIKPEFFIDEDIAALPPLTRILFQGLWCLADSEGRLEDRPQRIKIQILPYDKYDTDEGLSVLFKAGFIIRYTVEDQKLIQIRTFSKHQRLSGKEAQTESIFPRPELGSIGVASGKQPGSDGERLESQEGKGKERKGREGNIRACARKTSLPPDFGISDAVKVWAKAKGHNRLNEHLESFKAKCSAKGYEYVDWDSAFMEAIRKDWAELNRQGGSNGRHSRGSGIPDAGPLPEYRGEDLPPISEQERQANIERLRKITGGVCPNPVHPGRT